LTFLKSLLRRLRGRSPTLREQVEDAISRDDASALAEALGSRQGEGKALIRTYERELQRADSEAVRKKLAHRITALVAVYAQAFGDREPLQWFRREGKRPEGDTAAARLDEAQKAFLERDFGKADELASDALRMLEDEEATGDGLALRSTLLAIRGGVAVRQGRLEDALPVFESSLEWARRSAQSVTLGAALLNLIDLHTRRERFDEGEALLEEAERIVRETKYKDVLGKVLIERGVAQTRTGAFPGAISTFDRAVEAHPEWPFPFYQRAWARFLSGDSGGALDDYREAAARVSVFFTVQREIRCLEDIAAGTLPLDVYRAFCAVRDRVREHPEDVERSCAQLIELAPDFAPAYLLRAEAALALRDVDRAREWAREALLHDPDEDTAAAALFLEWNISRHKQEEDSCLVAAERLATAYRDHPPAKIVERIRESPDRNLALRWTFALDGSLHFQEVDPSTLIHPDQTPPEPGSGG
jgi:tetratricopeptide (TPR) repeat protein